MADAAILEEWQSPRLPWSRTRDESSRFAGILALTLLVFLPPAVLIPSMVLPERERAEVEKVPAHLARLVEVPKAEQRAEESALLAPEFEQPPEEKKGADEFVHMSPSSPTKAIDVKKGSDESLHLTPASPSPSESPSRQTVEQARENASRAGLLAMKDRLASLRASSDQGTALSANAGSAAASEAARPDQSKVLAGSGGVKDAEDPRADVVVASHEVKKVEAKADEPVRTTARGESASAKPSGSERPMSNIRRVFDAQKTALYSLYKRELRQDPTLAGKVLLELVIEPDGSVSACEVVSSELGNPTLEQRIAMRVRMFDFGAESVERRKVRFPVDFLPG